MAAIQCICNVTITADDAGLLAALRAHTDTAHGEYGITDDNLRDFIDARARLTPWDGQRLTQISNARSPASSRLPCSTTGWTSLTTMASWTIRSGRLAIAVTITSPARPRNGSVAGRRRNRAASAELIRAGRMHGLLAYVDGRPAGWMHAAPRMQLPYLERRGIPPSPEPERTGSITCYVIAAPYRRHGLARLLLEAACESFRARGLAYAEGYPARAPGHGDGDLFRGPESLYHAAGFTPAGQSERYLLMRRALT